MRAVCPRDPRHQRFETTAHVSQAWEVSPEGDFRAELQTLETTHGPDPGNIWTCLECDAEATVYVQDVLGERAAAQALEELLLAERAEQKLESGPALRPSGLSEPW